MGKENIVSDFDELIKVFAMRKKQILQTIDTKHKLTVNRLEDQYKNICQTAKTLIIAKEGISQQIRDSEPGKERQSDVIDLVESTLEECNKYTPTNYSYVLKAELKYNQGDNTQIKNYGKVLFNEE